MALINCIKIFNLIEEEVKSIPYFVGDFKTVQFQVSVSSISGTFSFRVLGSTKMSARLVDSRPDFQDNPTQANPYGYLFLTNLEDSSNWNGDDGFEISANGVYQFEVNVDGISWIGAEIFDFDGGIVTVDMTIINREQQ